MVTKNFQFFARRSEALGFLKELAQRHELWVILPSAGEHRVLDAAQFADIQSDAIDNVDRMFIAKEKPARKQLLATEVMPAMSGWMMFRFPIEAGTHLMLGDFSVKSDWFDKETGTNHENRNLPKLYSKLRADLGKRLNSPVWAINIKSGAAAKYPGIGCSRGASQWEAQGNELRQEGVNNVRFSSKPILERATGD